MVCSSSIVAVLLFGSGGHTACVCGVGAVELCSVITYVGCGFGVVDKCVSFVVSLLLCGKVRTALLILIFGAVSTFYCCRDGDHVAAATTDGWCRRVSITNPLLWLNATSPCLPAFSCTDSRFVVSVG